MAGQRRKPANPSSDFWETDEWAYAPPVPEATEGGESLWDAWQEESRRLDLAFAPTQPSHLAPLAPEPREPARPPRDHPLSADALMVEARRHNRVCPHPPLWQRLYEELEGDRHEDLPPPPTQPWMWSKLSSLQKRLRFREHIDWAERHRKLAVVAAFMDTLVEPDWLHMGES